MADVAIIHAADKGTAATRLAEAIAAAGFAVDSVRIEDPERLAEAVAGSAAEARILIWSRPLVSHALHSGELTRIRQLGGLIEVSADGIAPPSRGEDSRTISISGWRGQPFHPGWQRIHLELKRLCGPRRNPPAAAPAPGAREARAQRAAPAASGGGAQPKSRRPILGVGAAAALIAAAAGAAGWLGGGASDPPSRQELPKDRGVAATAQSPRPEPVPIDAGQIASLPAREPSLRPNPEPEAAPEARPETERVKPAERPAAPKPAARPKLRPSPKAEPAKKYSRKNSKIMRQFCERSGRSTPQCRTFLRSTRGAQAD